MWKSKFDGVFIAEKRLSEELSVHPTHWLISTQVPAAERMKMYQSFATELSIMVRLRHPRIVQVLGIITTDATYLGLVMEYMPGGSLRQALNKDDELITPQYLRFWASDVAQGMAYLYSCKIEHRDLKAERFADSGRPR